jgi:hypothetical protein
MRHFDRSTARTRRRTRVFYLIKGDLLLKNLEPDSRYKAFPHKMKLL